MMHTAAGREKGLNICFCLQDKFFAQLKSSANGFSVIADFFGRGLLDAASISTARPTL